MNEGFGGADYPGREIELSVELPHGAVNVVLNSSYHVLPENFSTPYGYTHTEDEEVAVHKVFTVSYSVNGRHNLLEVPESQNVICTTSDGNRTDYSVPSSIKKFGAHPQGITLE